MLIWVCVSSIIFKTGQSCQFGYALVMAFCCKPPSYVPYKGTYVPYNGTFGVPDQGQMLDV